MNRAEVRIRPVAGRTTLAGEQVAAALAELGSTAEQVADRLRALDIKGEQIIPCECPVAVYLLKRTGLKVFVSPFVAEWTVDWVTHMVPMPTPVGDFIANFDRGVYLDLVGTNGADRDR